MKVLTRLEKLEPSASDHQNSAFTLENSLENSFSSNEK